VIAPEEAIEPVFGALHDPDKLVRAMAFIILLGYDPPSTHADRIVSDLVVSSKRLNALSRPVGVRGGSARLDWLTGCCPTLTRSPGLVTAGQTGAEQQLLRATCASIRLAGR
jgi:hypothetical protein